MKSVMSGLYAMVDDFTKWSEWSVISVGIGCMRVSLSAFRHSGKRPGQSRSCAE